MNNFERLAEIKKQQAALEAEAKQIASELILEIKDLANDAQALPPFKLTNNYGEFAICSRTTWDYPEAIKKEEDLLKAKKKLAEEDGSATVKTCTEYLRFTAIKEAVEKNG